jgi:hypothetical protein
LLLGEVVALIHLPGKVEGFGFVGNDDIDHLAFFLLLVELPTKCDDVGPVGYPCLIEGFCGVSAFPCHDLAPVGSEMMENIFDGSVGIPKVLFLEFFNILFFNAVDDELNANVGDRLLQVKFLLKLLCFFLEGEYFKGGYCCRDACVDGVRLSDRLGGGDARFGNAGVIRVVKDKQEGSMANFPCGGFDGRDHLGHSLYHFVHGFCGRLPDNDVKGLGRHYEAHCLMNG